MLNVDFLPCEVSSSPLVLWIAYVFIEGIVWVVSSCLTLESLWTTFDGETSWKMSSLYVDMKVLHWK